MHLPPHRLQDETTKVLPRRRDALHNPAVAWGLLDDLHTLPGVIGTAIASRDGQIVLADVSAEGNRGRLESFAINMSATIRDVVARVGLGPLRMLTVQGRDGNACVAPVGPGLFVTISETSVLVAQLRDRVGAIQDELGRVELSAVLSASRRIEEEPPALPPRPVHVDRGAPRAPAQPAHPASEGGRAGEIVDERGVVMVFIPGGSFRMGSPDSPDESPVHEVTVSPFLIDKYPVTNEQYAAFVEASPTWRPGAANILLDEDYLSHWKKGACPGSLSQHPVSWVSWWQAAKGYCAWRDGRLPTEAEWEFAGRGADGRMYPWGDAWRTRRCNAYTPGTQWTSAVGEFPEGQSPFGVMDMSGNVWEWCADWYSDTYYATSEREDPTGPRYGRSRSMRGGCMLNHAEFVTLTRRLHFPPNHSDASIGFRCVKPWPPKFLA